MKAYVITSGEYSSYGIEHITLDKNKAYIFADYLNQKRNLREEYIVEEYDLDNFEIGVEEIKIGYMFTYAASKDYRGNYIHRQYYGRKQRIDNHKNEIVEYGNYGTTVYVYIDKNDYEKAFKIACDMFARYIEQKDKEHDEWWDEHVRKT